MTRAYAEGTLVSVEKTRAELDTLLAKHGATSRGILSDDLEARASVVFKISDRHYRVDVPLPRLEAFAMDNRSPPRKRAPEHLRAAWEQGCRERWRAVLLVVKAKLELVALGVSSIEREFLADMVLPGGERVHEQLKKAIAASYATGAAFQLTEGSK